MANERKTEQIVRDYLTKNRYYSDKDIIVEEQQSDNPKINKLLKNASKKGTGAGYPEFIIRSSKHPDLLIVIECKADIRKHESESREHYSDFAVDGVLLYASFLSKEYDVIAIAVSGETKSELRVSHFLYLKKDSSSDDLGVRKLLPFEDYYNAYIQDPRKFNQDYSALLQYSQRLNTLLHSRKIPESQRSLLISAILICLKNESFVRSYKAHRTAKQLAGSIVQTVINELEGSDIPVEKIDNLKYAYSFIKINAVLSQDKEFLEQLIDEINEEINGFMETHKYFDTLGQFYIEFLRYANNDKGLGIVLTPPHITELFVDLAGLTKDSIIYDNCCGTGGFLISAMKRMIADAKGDSRKIAAIKKKQIAGVEFQDSIYALAVSNMIIHGDGKSNIFQGDCFSESETMSKKFSPNVGFLNPPYKVHKDDLEELEYVLNNVNALKRNGVCIALIPMSCVLDQKGASYELKNRLLENHTLEAVVSLPDELFINSNVGVITSAIVITAHNPHPKHKKTWFGYWKKDGFVKVKNKGRIDSGIWKDTRNEWIRSYLNKDEVPGHSVKQVVKADDEWCAEAYMETDYSTLTKDEFIDSVKKYIMYQELYLK